MYSEIFTIVYLTAGRQLAWWYLIKKIKKVKNTCAYHRGFRHHISKEGKKPLGDFPCSSHFFVLLEKAAALSL